MSKFRRFGIRADQIARDAFERYESAAQALRRAEDARRACPERVGMVDADYAAKAARAAADVSEANYRVHQARLNLEQAEREIANIRAELAAAVASEFAANPAQVDAATMELLKSGICGPSDFASMMQEAQRNGNHTMMRLIAKYAGDAAEDRKSNTLIGNDTDAMRLTAIAEKGTENDGTAVMECFDTLMDICRMTVRNPSMIPNWGELTANALASM
jgi:hypothetical protein